MFKYAGQNTLTAASLPWLVEVIAADGIIIPASTVLGSQHPADTRESSAVVAPAPHPTTPTTPGLHRTAATEHFKDAGVSFTNGFLISR